MLKVNLTTNYRVRQLLGRLHFQSYSVINSVVNTGSFNMIIKSDIFQRASHVPTIKTHFACHLLHITNFLYQLLA